MPIKNGEQYKRSIDRLQSSVIRNGEKVSGNLSDHPAFSGLIASQAALYDMQGEEPYLDKMTYPSPQTGDPVGLSFLPPRTRKDLKRRRNMMSLWASRHHGFLGRSPDYMNTAIMAYATAADLLGEVNGEHAENLKQFYSYCREHDVTLSHAFAQPAGARLSALVDSYEEATAAKVHEYGRDGMTVSGAFLLATQAATSDELFVLTTIPNLHDERRFTFSFAIPPNTPGLTLVCRDSYVRGESPFDYPLSSRFEEMDALVLCDRVQVPRDRVFLYGDVRLANELTEESQFHAQVSYQTLCRYIAKTEFFLGTAERLAKLASIHSETIKDQLAELMVILEILKSLLLHAEAKAKKNRRGILVPDRNTMLATTSYFPKMYPRMIEIIQTLASSRLIMLPSEKDFQLPQTSSDLIKYLKISDTEAGEVVALNRLAWELSASAFAGRHVQYERYFFGGPAIVASRLYEGYDGRKAAMDKVRRFLRSP